MDNIPLLNIEDFTYHLPPERIARFPVEERDRSKLLIWQQGVINESVFRNLPEYLPERAHMIVNQTRVINARIIFQKSSGAQIEIFCLEPIFPTSETQQAFECKPPVIWKCLVGNSKRWRLGSISTEFEVSGEKVILWAERIDNKSDHSIIKFSWEPASLSFSEILNHAGVIPIPPYMDRHVTELDLVRYQTVYARDEGSVAAPTAGLHFTNDVLSRLRLKRIALSPVTLHVGAGTFKPVASLFISEHEMHAERFYVQRKTIQSLLAKVGISQIAVGTTSLRTIESLYWHGVKLLINKPEEPRVDVRQWDPYEPEYNCGITLQESIEAIFKSLDRFGLDAISGETQLMIVPGYAFKVANILITNFHLPRSTLLLLIAAFVGEGWKDVYRFALDNNFRFLSYGDSCLFYRNP